MKLNKKTSFGQMIAGCFLVASMPLLAQGQVSAGTNHNVLQAASSGNLIELGTRDNKPQHNTIISGFANELPLIDVLRQLTPSGWVVKNRKNEENPLNVNMLVSWSGGQNWVGVLANVASAHGLQVIVDWDEHSIMVMRARPPAAAAAAVNQRIASPAVVPQRAHGLFQLAGMADIRSVPQAPQVVAQAPQVVAQAPQVVAQAPQVVAQAPQVVAQAPQVVAQAPQVVAQAPQVAAQAPTSGMIGSRVIIEGRNEAAVGVPALMATQNVWNKSDERSLRDNVEDWAKKAGYNLVWLGVDYPVHMSVQLFGEFNSEQGPIHQLSVDYGPNSRVEVPLSFKFFQNRTLVVENWAFEQSGFPQLLRR